jgi:hypothetical protein
MEEIKKGRGRPRKVDLFLLEQNKINQLKYFMAKPENKIIAEQEGEKIQYGIFLTSITPALYMLYVAIMFIGSLFLISFFTIF